MTKINSFTDPTKVRKSGDTMAGVLTQNGANLAGTAYQSQSFQNLIVNGIPDSWSAGANAAPDRWILAIGSVSRDTGLIGSAVKLSGDYSVLQQDDVANYAYYRGKHVSASAWVKTSTPNRVYIRIPNGLGGEIQSSYHSGSGLWEKLNVSGIQNIAATVIGISYIISNSPGQSVDAWFTGAILVEGSTVPAFSERPLYDDGHTLQIDSVNNRVGVNNPAPVHTLDLTGDVNITGNFLASKKVGTFTRDMSLATGTQAITGVGFKPSAIIFFAAQNGQLGASWGFSDGSTGYGMEDNSGQTVNTHSAGVDLIYILQAGGSNIYKAGLSSFDSDGFTLSWTKVASSTGTANIMYMAFR